MIATEPRRRPGGIPLLGKVLLGVCLAIVAGLVLLAGFVGYIIIELGSALDDPPKTAELRVQLKEAFPAGTPLTEITSYLDSEPGRYEVKSGRDVDEYFETLGLAQGTQRSQVESVVDAATPVEGGFLASARLLFYFDADGRLVRLVVCQEYDCAA